MIEETNEYTFFAVASNEPFVLTKEMQTEECKKKEEDSTTKFLEKMNEIERQKKLILKNEQ